MVLCFDSVISFYRFVALWVDDHQIGNLLDCLVVAQRLNHIVNKAYFGILRILFVISNEPKST